MKNILFYKYVAIADLDLFRNNQYTLCRSLNLKGKVLIAYEGINGALTGEDEKIEEYKKQLLKDPRFHDIVFKQHFTRGHNFKKLFVKKRKEIIAFGLDSDVDLNNRGSYLPPKKFKQILDSGQDIAVLDARNNYETRLGTFDEAVTLDIESFNQFPAAVKKLTYLKNKPVILYCTGGVRCEKASAYLVEQGFMNVMQLHGGIINYGIECGDSHWHGKCFVFDRRGAIEIDPQKQVESDSQCTICFIPTEHIYTCKNDKCGKKFSACEECLNILKNCCSKHCRNSLLELMKLRLSS